MKHIVSFDIDQTLVNTHKLNAKAYARFGVTIPDYAIGLRWQTWLYNVVGNQTEAEIIHKKKVFLYLEMLRNCDINEIALPPSALARELIHRTDVDVRFATAATMTTATMILRKLGLQAPLASNLSYEARRLLLHTSVLSSDGVAAYVDDRKDTIISLELDVPGLRCIHYTGQTKTELRTLLSEIFSGKS